jgi:hypothetical protein
MNLQARLLFWVVALLCLSRCVNQDVGSGTGSSKGRVLYRFLSKHGSPQRWSADVLARYATAASFSRGFIAKITRLGLSGRNLADLNDDDDVEHFVDSDPDDLVRLKKLFAQIQHGPGLSFDELSSFGGAERFDLTTLREADRLDFHSFIWALGSSPHVAMLGLRVLRPHFDAVMFGRDEITKSPFSWWHFVLAPGTLAVRYFWVFYETDLVMVTLLTVSYIISDLVW